MWHRGYSITLGTLCVSVMCQGWQKKDTGTINVQTKWIEQAKIVSKEQHQMIHVFLAKFFCIVSKHCMYVQYMYNVHFNTRLLPPTAPHSFYLLTQSTTILHNPKSRQKKVQRDNRTRISIVSHLQSICNATIHLCSISEVAQVLLHPHNDLRAILPSHCNRV